MRPLVFLCLTSFANIAYAQILPYADATPEMPFRQRNIWVAPEQLFALELPTTWVVVDFDKSRGATLIKPTDERIDASLLLRHITVPHGASPRQLMLNAIEQRLNKLPSFRETARRDVMVAANPAAIVSGVYYYQGNAQFPRVIEELFVVRGNEAFVFHFECFAPIAGHVGTVLDGFYKSFTIRPRGAGGVGGGALRAPAPGMLDPDRIPF